MDNNKRKIVFIIIELLIIFLIVYNVLNIGGINAIILNIVLLLFMFIFYWLLNENRVYHLFGKYFMSKKLNNSIEENIDYFREIINKYSIGELSFLDGYDIDYPKDIIAIILKLKLIKIIDIVDNKIIILKKNVELKKSENYILDSVKDGKVILENDLKLKKIVKNELIDSNLLLKEYTNNSILSKVRIISIILFVIWFVGFFIISNIDLVFEENLMAVMGVLFGVIFSSFVIISVIESVRNNFLIKLTDDGKTIKARLNGLKRYLEYFSVINKRRIEELFLYDDYLIYSVMFNINKDIIAKYNDLVVVENELYVEIK